MIKPPFKRVVIDPEAADYPLTSALLGRLPDSVEVIRLTDPEEKPTGRSTLYVTLRKGPFLKPCPCTPGAVSCGYRVFSPAFMCPYSCSYCFLRFYAPDEPLTVYANLSDAEKEFHEWADTLTEPVRVGTGEFADSLALDPWTGHAAWVANLVKDHPLVQMELKTKSGDPAPFLATPSMPNLVAAWSLNPPAFAKSDEPGAAPTMERLRAAAAVSAAGRPVAFHFDPLIALPKFKEEYSALVKDLFDAVDPALVRWISLGTLRFPRRFMDAWGPKLRGNPLFFEEFVLGEDGKLRYLWPERRDIYRFMAGIIRDLSGGRVKVYLCMEPLPMWKGGLDLEPGEGWVERHLSQ